MFRSTAKELVADRQPTTQATVRHQTNRHSFTHSPSLSPLLDKEQVLYSCFPTSLFTMHRKDVPFCHSWSALESNISIKRARFAFSGRFLRLLLLFLLLHGILLLVAGQRERSALVFR